MNSDDLFPEAHRLSPRLAWLKKHGLQTALNPKSESATEFWYCSKHDNTAWSFGETEHDAIITFCEDYRIKHYSLE